ncbi:hypothetical protein [Dictyobacter aurantiacus]|uniref:Uncharacterized protein n=1 Tax=Dictyobacter aurantiacus TaxID=1936993 RepID=A0A401ZN69_9CHLR|nr:hypothetical protein [Dictyobacter aurantiacus]GCE08309.1 hypothetical protein KDAU_56380 [Dictyobacter aurantiacus]
MLPQPFEETVALPPPAQLDAQAEPSIDVLVDRASFRVLAINERVAGVTGVGCDQTSV